MVQRKRHQVGAHYSSRPRLKILEETCFLFVLSPRKIIYKYVMGFTMAAIIQSQPGVRKFELWGSLPTNIVPIIIYEWQQSQIGCKSLKLSTRNHKLQNFTHWTLKWKYACLEFFYSPTRGNTILPPPAPNRTRKGLQATSIPYKTRASCQDCNDKTQE